MLRLSLVVESRGHPLILACGFLIAVAPLVVEHRLQGLQASVAAACGLNNCAQIQLPQGIWDPPRSGIKSVFPALQGRHLTNGPPGKPISFFFLLYKMLLILQRPKPMGNNICKLIQEKLIMPSLCSQSTVVLKLQFRLMQ